ncbi:hypothetical protein LZP73_11085 [Shewanella sp. AS16]|uniref:hypothetical protein n=1 Tax=Shewanella sp. AS16 TaxID=2907625 RepID=UPI001F2B351E|nr:hypothetical protein [Shewanella sp. AS16]MCE9686749.1 hypothetical protein [Shewanella sp. AS16]
MKPNAELSPLISTAWAQFAMEVRQGSFPTSAHCFTMLEQPECRFAPTLDGQVWLILPVLLLFRVLNGFN